MRSHAGLLRVDSRAEKITRVTDDPARLWLNQAIGRIEPHVVDSDTTLGRVVHDHRTLRQTIAVGQGRGIEAEAVAVSNMSHDLPGSVTTKT